MPKRADLPALSILQILNWADAHHARTGRWPTRNSGPVQEAPDETWGGINSALDQGWRGLPGGNSLAQLLNRHRQKRKSRPGVRPWTPEEDELVHALPPEEAARRTRRGLLSVHVRRSELGLPDIFSG
jgi:hypothetical protein